MAMYQLHRDEVLNRGMASAEALQGVITWWIFVKIFRALNDWCCTPCALIFHRPECLWIKKPHLIKPMKSPYYAKPIRSLLAHTPMFLNAVTLTTKFSLFVSQLFSIMKMLEAGLLTNWRQKWWARAENCTSKSRTGSASGLSLDTLGGVFIVYLGCAGLAVIILLVSIIASSKWRCTSNRNSAGKEDEPHQNGGRTAI